MKLVIEAEDYRSALSPLEWTELSGDAADHLGASDVLAAAGSRALRYLPKVLAHLLRNASPPGMQLSELEVSCEIEVSLLGTGLTGVATVRFSSK